MGAACQEKGQLGINFIKQKETQKFHFRCSCLQATRSEASLQQEFERLFAFVCMESFSFDHPRGSIVKITGNFSFPIDNVKQVDAVVNIVKYAEEGHIVFSP